MKLFFLPVMLFIVLLLSNCNSNDDSTSSSGSCTGDSCSASQNVSVVPAQT